MSYTKKYIELQDMILARTALEKVKMHVKERKDRTVFSWVSAETQEFVKKFSKYQELSDCISKISIGIKNHNYIIIEENIDKCIELLSKKINEIYAQLMKEQE